jgi:hypothetical protein
MDWVSVVLVWNWNLEPCESCQRIVAARLVIDSPDDGRLVHPLGSQGEMLADLNSRHAGGNRLELPADFSRRLRLEVVHVLRRSSAMQEQDDHALRLAARSAQTHFLCIAPSRETEHAPQQSQSAGLQALAARYSVAETSGAAQKLEHRRTFDGELQESMRRPSYQR